MTNLILAGDVMIGRTFNEIFKLAPNFNIFGDTLKITKGKNDIFCINLETTLADYTAEKWNKLFNYQLDPKFANVLKKGNVDYCALSNNHILDFMPKGLKQTTRTLNTLKIKHSGAGENKLTPAIFGKIGIFSASDHPLEWKSYSNVINLKNEAEVRTLEQGIKKYKRQFKLKFVVLFMHWGANFLEHPTSEMQRAAKILLSNGTVNVIAGTSSHHIQRAEQIGDGIVFYGLGDYIDDFALNKKFRSDLGILAKLKLDSDYKLKRVDLIPIKITFPQVNLANAKDSKIALSKLIG